MDCVTYELIDKETTEVHVLLSCGVMIKEERPSQWSVDPDIGFFSDLWTSLACGKNRHTHIHLHTNVYCTRLETTDMIPEPSSLSPPWADVWMQTTLGNINLAIINASARMDFNMRKYGLLLGSWYILLLQRIYRIIISFWTTRICSQIYTSLLCKWVPQLRILRTPPSFLASTFAAISLHPSVYKLTWWSYSALARAKWAVPRRYWQDP